MTTSPFVSYAQNREDVVLHRALGDLTTGRYIDVGANDPEIDSISRAFYDAGWRGITIEPMHDLAEKHRAERPGDLLVEGVVTERSGDTLVLHQITGTGLSTLIDEIGERHQDDGLVVTDIEVTSTTLNEVLDAAGWAGQDIHFMTVDTEGTEESVLRGIDLKKWRPWILVIEATEPRSSNVSYAHWEPIVLDAGYRFAQFDGLSRFYVAAEHADRLGPLLEVPGNPSDNFETKVRLQSDAELARLLQATTDLEAARAHLASERAQLVGERDRLDAELHAAVDQISAIEAERVQDVDALLRWRGAAFGAWSRAATSNIAPAPVATSEELTFLRNHTHAVTNELAAMKKTLSWRVTRPLRMVRRLGKLVGR